ncbi:MAG: Stealth CR1 domain-containing protein, partial [Paracoccaceae bacterium]
MTHPRPETDAPIDAVITWVDGNTLRHRRAREHYMAQAGVELHENAVNPHRWASSGEILYCLQSIENFAPWMRKLWIVVDHEVPDLSPLSAELRAKTEIVLHKDIFREFNSDLPTFNSLAIESLLWRIDGLSERFVYFNDDVFLTEPLQQAEVFQGDLPVLRGSWVDYSALLDAPGVRADPAKFNHFMQINAAQMAGVTARRMFATDHVVHPMCRTVMARLFDHHAEAFSANVKHRFRDLSQFLPQGLHNQTCLAENAAVINAVKDHLH